jgi:hypothetical protein
MKRMIMPAVLAVGVVAGGCVVHGHGTARVHTPAPRLAYVSPGVHVVYDYHEPVFYSDGYYWRYYNGVWFRSSVYTGGWVRVRTVPVAVRRVDRPQAYVRYRGSGRVHTAPARPGVRDHRTPARSRQAPARGPAVRDHRAAPQRRAAPPPRQTTPARKAAPPPRKKAPPPRAQPRDRRDRDR